MKGQVQKTYRGNHMVFKYFGTMEILFFYISDP